MKIRPSILSCTLSLILVAAVTASAQSPAPVATSANTITVVANGICLTFTPGNTPAITATSTEVAPPAATPSVASSPGLNPRAIPASSATPIPVAVSKSFHFVDKHGRTIDSRTIKPTERLQPLFDSGPTGQVLQAVMVDRD
jgi:hypothetical protein